MRICLNRTQLYLLGLALIFLFLILNRLNILINSERLTGKVVAIQGRSVWLDKIAPVFYFEKAPALGLVSIYSKALDIKVGDELTVLFPTNNIGKARILSFADFFATAVIWTLIPIILLTAAVFSYFSPKAIWVYQNGAVFKMDREQLKLERK